MLSALALSLRQLGDPRIVRVLGKVVLLSLLVFVALGVGGWWGMSALLARFDRNDGAVAALAGVVLAVAAGWLLWRGVAIAILNLFADEVVDAVEARHYPAQRALARPLRIAASVALSLASLWRLVWVNALALPLYLVAALTGAGLPIALLLVNGWLLGRDLADMVAVRHRSDRHDARWGLPPATRLLLGTAAMVMLSVPFVNLVAPVLGAGMATHLVHRRAGGAR